jgi:hypothetical protein
MNPPKPMDAKRYVPRTPKILRVARPSAVRGINDRKVAVKRRATNGQHTGTRMREAWQNRLAGQYSQASRAGVVSTLLRSN